MGNVCLKKLYKKMPVTEKCYLCKKERYIGGTETAFMISVRGCRVCRLKKKYCNPITNKEVSIEQIKINRGRYN